jgi:hypothetical protein
MLLTHAKTNKNSVYLSVLDCKGPFKLVMHDALFEKMKRVRLLEPLIDVIIDLYKESVVRVWNQGKVSGSVAIRKGVKQECPLLFNISINPIFGHIMKPKNNKYVYLTDEFSCNFIQAYTDDVILIAI